MPEPSEPLEINDMVASTEFGQELNLERLADDLPATEYLPERFPGLVFQTQSPKAATFIFRPGKAVVTGATSIEEAETALGTVQSQLQEPNLLIL